MVLTPCEWTLTWTVQSSALLTSRPSRPLSSPDKSQNVRNITVREYTANIDGVFGKTMEIKWIWWLNQSWGQLNLDNVKFHKLSTPHIQEGTLYIRVCLMKDWNKWIVRGNTNSTFRTISIMRDRTEAPRISQPSVFLLEFPWMGTVEPSAY